MKPKKIYKVDTMCKNIVNYYNICTPADINAGNFYGDALKFASDLSKEYKYTTEQICGFIAALSPQTTWELNKRDTMKMCKGNKVGYATYKANVVKAQGIKKVTDTEQIYDIIYGRGANKTANFYLNITGNYSVVTVDRHAYKIAMNKTAGGGVALTTKQYKQIETAYIIAAKKLNLEPAILQAITWNCFKRLNDRGKYIDQSGTDCPF
jgi:co-chaperonin GroES (HSP10)